MTTGCLIFAYDGDIAYGPQAMLAAKLVKKNLGIPVTLITDSDTLMNIDQTIFDSIKINSVESNNTRVLGGQTISFKNINRSHAYDTTPYDRTLVIDSDFLVLSNNLKTYLDSNRPFMICEGMNDFLQRDKNNELLNPASVPMLWATNIIFSKSPEVKALFDLVDHIRENWEYYGSLYKFDVRRFRNDYAFSVACHILSGFGIEKFYNLIPAPVLFTDKDKLVQLKNKTFTFLMDETVLVRTKDQDIHYMNKYELLENLNILEELVND